MNILINVVSPRSDTYLLSYLKTIIPDKKDTLIFEK